MNYATEPSPAMYGIGIEYEEGKFGMIDGPCPSLAELLNHCPAEESKAFILSLEKDQKLFQWDSDRGEWFSPKILLLTFTLLFDIIGDYRGADSHIVLTDMMYAQGIKGFDINFDVSGRPIATIYGDGFKVKCIPQDQYKLDDPNALLAKRGHQIMWVVKDNELKGKIHNGVWTSFKPW